MLLPLRLTGKAWVSTAVADSYGKVTAIQVGFRNMAHKPHQMLPPMPCFYCPAAVVAKMSNGWEKIVIVAGGTHLRLNEQEELLPHPVVLLVDFEESPGLPQPMHNRRKGVDNHVEYQWQFCLV